mmetsp:Transcript_41226/g.101719  ORF Transcript_41226/g.101719 Transcript_41226/m.101719 type:complete len:603 (+) Transcript_41226:43-1851(+)
MSEGLRDPLFSEFIVVGLTLSGTGGRLTPVVKYHYSTSSKSSDVLLKTCVNFCFPVAGEVGKTAWPASESFTYTLTEDDGTRLFGFCRRLLQPPNTLPDAICILAKRQWFSFYSHMLDILQLRFDLEAFVPPFIRAVASTPPPAPGASCVVSPWGERGDTFRLSAPDASMPPVASFELLFQTLGTVNVLRLVAALVNESRVVIIASRLGDISTIAHCAMALLQPFTWQHVFIPVLPTSMIDYVCAPMPFVVGVLEAHRHLLLQQPMDECVFVEVDKGKLKGDELVPQLPRPYRDNLFRSLESLQKARNGHPRYDPRLVTDAFLTFFAELLRDYREHADEVAVRSAREAIAAAALAGKRPPRVAIDDMFDHVKFVAAQPRELHEFMGALRGVQMWEAWLSDSLLLPDERRKLIAFEKRLADVAGRLATLPSPLDGKAKVSSAQRAREAVVGLRFAMASSSPVSVSPQVAAAVGQARARAGTVASSLREKAALMPTSFRRSGGSGIQLSSIDADEMVAGIVLHSNAPSEQAQQAQQGVQGMTMQGVPDEPVIPRQPQPRLIMPPPPSVPAKPLSGLNLLPPSATRAATASSPPPQPSSSTFFGL